MSGRSAEAPDERDRGAATSRKLTLARLPGRFTICRLPAAAPVPPWAHGGSFSSVTRTPEELSVVCAEGRVPPETVAEGGWACLRVNGPLDLAETGILASLSGALARRGVSVFAVSTFDTDCLLVREGELDAAARALAEAGHRVVE